MIARLLVSLAFFGTSPAFAHPPPLGVIGFTGGLLHPAFVPAHLLAILALGLLTARHGGWTAVAGFAATLGAGLFAMTLGVVPQYTTEAVTVLAALMGMLVAWGRRLATAIAALLGAATGLCVALDSPPETISIDEANRMLIGTGLGALALLAVCVWIARGLVAFRSGIGTRVAGSWIAASAILFLALRFTR
jgi:hydrogenase/urease accessory protein HupE